MTDIRQLPNSGLSIDIDCLCPGCGERHIASLFWTGNGTPRIYCTECRLKMRRRLEGTPKELVQYKDVRHTTPIIIKDEKTRWADSEVKQLVNELIDLI